MLHPNYKVILRLLDRTLKNRKKISVIDYGCGSGYLLELLPPDKIERYVGYDVNKDSILKARQKYKGIKNAKFILIKRGVVPKLNNDYKIDAIILVGVLQYMDNNEINKLIISMRRALRKGGVFVTSCAADHTLYKFMNFYGLFIPNRYIDRKIIKQWLDENGMIVNYIDEKGLLLGPLFSHFVFFFFDALDKVIFRTAGYIGIFGQFVRRITTPLLSLEYYLPIDYGYTLYIRAEKV